MKIEIERLPNGRLKIRIWDEAKIQLALKGKPSEKKRLSSEEIWYIR